MCVICLEDRPIERAHRCQRCDTNCCNNCFGSYLTHKIDDGDVAPHQLVCPGSCRQPIPRAVLAQFVSPSYLQKYIRFLTAYELRQRGHRYCPRPQCGQLLPTSTSHKTKTKRRVDCPSCQQSSCRDCGGGYHRWPQCDRQYRSWCHAHAAQRCPQCSTTIEKDGGCSHIKCTYCHYDFCWRCRVKWADHNHTLCLPVACVRSTHWAFGPIAPRAPSR
ncbi:hypothetical protein SPRG_14880 [Saprolegnia parasitica CBS 223.65]|uniref:RBR-type E3 ubiquitin transferase n=1 Tax=Saprolegnia parasitica (strain CBS 223.65) TaxID=695850 RepID=A0A067BRD1_SAPPC|nr:hypothetical protein SPRG_14880 [Saprolegnia parasitica CBS 223.65]KDO19360.1 hypothetical protein SPRG_14880 [Saprolegnia parasitica CBS 223.65]|eukprot:XP_012209948.1 hypothetical protein SPRG_14880 [Saprolegnia parasitica CBS 223.65]